MKNVTIRCCKCNQEIFGGMEEWTQKCMTVHEANNSRCSDCWLAKVMEEEKQYLDNPA